MKSQWKIFADFYLACSDHIAAAKAAYPKLKDDKVAATRGKQLLVNETISAYIQERQIKIQEAKESELIRAAKAGVLSEIELDLFLSRIIKGEEFDQISFTVKNDIVGALVKSASVKPGLSDRIKAAELLYRRFGSYAGFKLELSKKLESLTDEQLMQLAEIILKQQNK